MVVSIANGLFEQFDSWDFNHMLGEIGAELQGICTDENRILQHKGFHGRSRTDGPWPDRIPAGGLSTPIDWWQQGLALIVGIGREVIHAHR